MKDFPIFDTPFGVASLTLREIPYREEAFVQMQSVLSGKQEALLAECVSFCRMVGAERVYGTGEGNWDGYPLYTAVYEMRGTLQADPAQVENLFPVTEETVSRWREIYNAKMRSVDNARTLARQDEAEILSKPGAYFVHRNGTLLGIGWLREETLLAVAAVVPGAGSRVMHTLLSLAEGSPVRLEVASTNLRAIGLYEKLGFVKTAVQSRWYILYKKEE